MATIRLLANRGLGDSGAGSLSRCCLQNDFLFTALSLCEQSFTGGSERSFTPSGALSFTPWSKIGCQRNWYWLLVCPFSENRLIRRISFTRSNSPRDFCA